MTSPPPLCLVFVIGCQRTGTTLTGQILGAHPKAVLLDEPDGIYPWFRTLDPNDLRLNGTMFSMVLEKAATKYRDIKGRFVRSSEGRFDLDPQITHLVFKAPNLTYFRDQISAIGEKVRVVALMRDPRDTVVSMAKLSNIPMVENQIGWIAGIPALEERFAVELSSLRDPLLPISVKRVLVWRIKTTLAQEFSSLENRFMMLKYEELVTDPEKCAVLLSRHLNLSCDEFLLSHQHVMKGVGPGKTQRFRPIDSTSVAKWKASLDREVAAQLLDLAGPLAGPYRSIESGVP